jgi:hypothetical protein
MGRIPSYVLTYGIATLALLAIGSVVGNLLPLP